MLTNKNKKIINIILIINNIKIFLTLIKDLITINKNLDNYKISYE